MPFCSQYVSKYPSVCLPNEYSYFPNHTLGAKDRWISDYVGQQVARREAIEEKNGNGFKLCAFIIVGGFCCFCVCA